MLRKQAKLMGKIMGELALTLPFSLITKLADGKLTREELQGLIKDITVAVAKVVVEEYKEATGDCEFDNDSFEDV